MSNNDAVVYSHKLDIFLLAVGSAGIFVTIYHCIMACWCDRRRHNADDETPAHDLQSLPTVETPRSTENSVVHLIPAYKYQKDMALEGGGGDEGTCAICLSEFEDGEEIRTLPECMHSYHVPCIDMWLYSHSSCPICRADATPTPSSPAVFSYRLEFDQTQPNSGMIVHVRHTRE